MDAGGRRANRRSLPPASVEMTPSQPYCHGSCPDQGFRDRLTPGPPRALRVGSENGLVSGPALSVSLQPGAILRWFEILGALAPKSVPRTDRRPRAGVAHFPPGSRRSKPVQCQTLRRSPKVTLTILDNSLRTTWPSDRGMCEDYLRGSGRHRNATTGRRVWNRHRVEDSRHILLHARQSRQIVRSCARPSPSGPPRTTP
jgi:hypothetical protein